MGKVADSVFSTNNVFLIVGIFVFEANTGKIKNSFEQNGRACSYLPTKTLKRIKA
jgi:hypothetical protein